MFKIDSSLKKIYSHVEIFDSVMEGRFPSQPFIEKVHTWHLYITCTYPESFVRRGPTLTTIILVDEGGEMIQIPL